MICWKSINLSKEFGLNRLYLISFLIGLVAFILLYVPFSIMNRSVEMDEAGFIPFIITILLLPAIRSCAHLLPLVMLKKQVKPFNRAKNKIIRDLSYSTKRHLSKDISLLVAIAPTILITIPAIIAAYIFPSFSVYILMFASFHIGLSTIDFLYIAHIMKAPKQSVIENRHDGFDILVKEKE